MSIKRPRATYANLVSTLALVVSLGAGTAYAANTIGSSDIIDESILSADLKDGEVMSSEIAPGAVGSDKIASGAVTLNNLAGVNVQTTLSIKPVARGACRSVAIPAVGATPGQLVAMTPRAKVQSGVVLQAQQVRRAGRVATSVCYFGRKPMRAITNLPVLVVTFA